MHLESDLPFEFRVITEEEAEKIPKHEKPMEPSDADEEEKIKKIKHENEHGHPAFAMREEYRKRGDVV